jgi:DNA-binding NarL/FixJ family response regulator
MAEKQDNGMVKTVCISLDGKNLIYDGLTALFHSSTVISPAGGALDDDQALELCRRNNHDAVLISVSRPSLELVSLTQKLLKVRSSERIMVISESIQDNVLLMGVRTGILGYARMAIDFSELEFALQMVSRGKRYFCQTSSSIIADHVTGGVQDAGVTGRYSTLTDREKEVMIALLQGLSVKDVAEELKISVKTVTTHKARIYRKFQIHSMLEFVKLGVTLGL